MFLLDEQQQKKLIEQNSAHDSALHTTSVHDSTVDNRSRSSSNFSRRPSNRVRGRGGTYHRGS